MKTMIRPALILLFPLICKISLHACTSFAVYSTETWYGMNFDYPDVDIKFSISQTGSGKIFRAQFGSGSYIAGMNDAGLFTNYQLLYYNNGEPTFPAAGNILHIGDLNNYSLSYLTTVDEITDYIGTKILVPSWGLDLHTLFADSTSKAMVTEPFGTYNGITPQSDNFIVMTNFPNYDFIGMNYTSVHGAGADRYKTAYAYINDHKTDFGYNEGMETLSRTIQSSGGYPTQVSLLFNPAMMEIFFCMNRDFSKVWKISLKNKTIETFSGFDSYAIEDLGATGIWSYELSSIHSGIKEIDPLNPEKDVARIYPNPAVDLLLVNIDNQENEGKMLKIYNLSGELVSSVYLKQNQQQISIANLIDGFYMIEIQSKEGIDKQKLIIQK